MSASSPLRERVHEAFKKAFGAPDRVYGVDMHWSLRRFAYMAAVNVLVNGSSEEVVVWVFDPHDRNDGIQHQAVTTDAEIAPLVAMISDRVRLAWQAQP